MKKLLVIGTTFPRWKDDTIPNFVYELAKEHTKNYEVHVICPHSYKSKSYEEMDEIKVHRFKYFVPKYENLSKGISIANSIKENKLNIFLIPSYIFFGSIKILSLLFKYQFDIVHTHWLVPFAPVSSFLKKFFNYKLIITSHGGDTLGYTKGLGKKVVTNLSKYSISKANHFTVVSSEIERVAIDKYNIKPSSNMSIISMGIPYDEFSLAKPSFSKKDFSAVFIGRLSEVKGTRHLIEAITLLSKNKETLVKCKIIGDGIERKSLEKLCEKNCIEKLVSFRGSVPHSEVPKELNGTGVFVGPSITTEKGIKEGFGLVFIEAMAAGLPVIASRSGGIVDTVKDKVTGLLVEEKDYKKIAEYIIELRDNASLRDKLIKNGREIAKQYSWENIAKKYSKLYEN